MADTDRQTIRATDLRPGHVIIDGDHYQTVLAVIPTDDNLEVVVEDDHLGYLFVDIHMDEDVEVES